MTRPKQRVWLERVANASMETRAMAGAGGLLPFGLKKDCGAPRRLRYSWGRPQNDLRIPLLKENAVGLYSHSTHLFIPDKDHARLLAGAMLKSPHSLVISTPYGQWINVYLPMGLSYKDVPELPTTTNIELNCYNSEGFDLRLYSQDRLAFLFESGCGDVSEEEDELLQIAEKIWREDPDRPTVGTPVITADGEDAEALKSKEPTFWDLPQDIQDEYLARARKSADFNRFVERATQTEDNMPELSAFEPFLPSGRNVIDFQVMLSAASKRQYGPPTDEREKVVLEKWMRGKNHSVLAEDYVAAIADFLEFKGALWSLETILQIHSDKVDRRIIKIEELQEKP